MADLEKELAEILSDKQSLQKLQQMAQTLLSGENSGQTKGQNDGENPRFLQSGETAALQNLPFDINKLTKLYKTLSTRTDDRAVQLINALIPYLDKPKQERANRAARLLRLWSAVPVLKESGILDDRF